MREARILVRVHDRPGALERVLGLVRRRAAAVRRSSIATGGDGVLEVLLRVDASRTPADRLCHDLRGLYDVLDVREMADAPDAPTREMLLAWVRPGAARGAPATARVLAVETAGVLLELTGSPDEIDGVLARLGETGAVTAVRSGEVAAPAPVPNTLPERNSE
jgi:acetolactate synthase small subunit